MRADSGRSLMMILLIGSFAAACSGGGSFSSPTSPTPLAATPSSPVPPVPGSNMFTLTGRITETPPTALTGIGGAIVTIGAGQNAGRSATTNPMGFYTIPDVVEGSTITVSAEGYLNTSGGAGVGRATGDFQLMPVPRTTTSTLSDTLSGQVGTCSDGVSARPCHILAIPIHNNGPLEATLTWDPAGTADLDLTLFRSGSSSFIARSASRGADAERINTDLIAGSTFELRVTYASGTGAPKYTLRVTHQN